MSHYKPYPAYKDSGVEWIGRLPEHWETLRIKRAAQLRNERRNDSPEGWIYVGLEDVESESGKYEPTVGTSRQSEDSMVGVFRAGDVLYGKLRPYLRKAIVAEQDGVCSTEFLVLSEARGKSPWLHRWLLTQEVTQQIEAGCDGAKMPRADWGHVGSIPMPLPPVTEQTAIATALDRETTRIDALIAKKTRFIDLLKEKRQALITHAVTKGLDPNVKMKDSGVEWIGEVPEHWEIAHVKRLLDEIEYGLSETSEESGTVEFLTMGNIQGGQILRSRNRFLDSAPESMLVKKGDILFNRTNSLDLVGKVGIYLDESSDLVTFASYLVRFRCRKDVNSEYVAYFLGSEEVLAFARTMALPSVSQANLNPNRYGYLSAPLPPLTEQNQVVDHINAQSNRLRLLVQRTERSITLLKERRSALITAAVTGQIDVRGAA